MILFSVRKGREINLTMESFLADVTVISELELYRKHFCDLPTRVLQLHKDEN